MAEDWEALYNELSGTLNKVLDRLDIPVADFEGDASMLRLIFLEEQVEMERRDALHELFSRGYGTT